MRLLKTKWTLSTVEENHKLDGVSFLIEFEFVDQLESDLAWIVRLLPYLSSSTSLSESSRMWACFFKVFIFFEFVFTGFRC